MAATPATTVCFENIFRGFGGMNSNHPSGRILLPWPAGYLRSEILLCAPTHNPCVFVSTPCACIFSFHCRFYQVTIGLPSICETVYNLGLHSDIRVPDHFKVIMYRGGVRFMLFNGPVQSTQGESACLWDSLATQLSDGVPMQTAQYLFCFNLVSTIGWCAHISA